MKRLLVVMVFFIISCASIFTGKNQNIPVFTKPDGAKVTVYNMSKIKVFEGVTPCYIVQSKEILMNGFVTIEKEGYKKIEMPLGEQIEPWCWGNCLLGGIIGGGIDILSGSWKRASLTKIDAIMESESLSFNDSTRYEIKLMECGNAYELYINEL